MDNPPDMPDTDERPMLAALDEGNVHRAMELIMAAYGTRVFGYCARTLKDASLAEDVHQLVFVQAFESLPTFGRRSSIRTWLFGIACHRCLDALKVTRRFQRRFLHVVADHEDPAAATTDAALDAASVSRALDDCLGKLPEPVRMVLLLRYHEGFTFEQMGEMLREKPGTLQARAARAMPGLRECMAAKGISP